MTAETRRLTAEERRGLCAALAADAGSDSMRPSFSDDDKARSKRMLVGVSSMPGLLIRQVLAVEGWDLGRDAGNVKDHELARLGPKLAESIPELVSCAGSSL